MSTLLPNLRFALRQLRTAPAFTATVILTLALGMGATIAVFSLVEGILLRPLPFADPDGLVLLGDHLGPSPNVSVTAREIDTYTRTAGAFSSIGAYFGTSYELSGTGLSGSGTPEQVVASRLTAGVFPTLGVQPLLGRVFTQQDEDAHRPVAVLSYALWLTRFNGDPNVLGRAIVLDRRPYTITGVMPRTFEFPLQSGHVNQSQLWVPMSMLPDELSDKNAGMWGYNLIARLRPGVTLPQAAQDADRVAQQVMRDFPATMHAIRIRGDVRPLREEVVADARPLLRTLLFAVAIVLVIAAVNVAGLLLVRAIRRRREYAVRLALGARSSAILRQSMLEGLVLSVAGGLLGFALAAAVLRVALRLLPESMPRVDAISIDWVVTLFALLLALVTGALCSLAPAFAALRTNLMTSLKEGVRSGSGAASHTWLRSGLVVSEIAVALILLTLTAAFLRSFQNMRAVDPGFRPDHLLVASFQLPLNQYATDTAAANFNRALLERLSAQPAVVAAGITNSLPATNSSALSAYTIADEPIDSWKLKFAAFATADGDYFRAMGIPLLAGRTFTADDNASAPLVILVNQSMARHRWPGQSPIGKRLHAGNPHKGYPWTTIVGVVADTHMGSRDEVPYDQWYIPANQPATLWGTDVSPNLSRAAGGYIALRSTLPPEQMIQTLRATVAQVDPLLSLQEVQPMDAAISNVEAPRTFNTALITAFALGALLLSVVGIYAVVAFSVSLRSQEIAIRMALGAQRPAIARLILVSGIRMALIGCALGIVAALALSRLVASFLFGVSATNPILYIASAAIMIVVALLASALPALRAASSNPTEALRAN